MTKLLLACATSVFLASAPDDSRVLEAYAQILLELSDERALEMSENRSPFSFRPATGQEALVAAALKQIEEAASKSAIDLEDFEEALQKRLKLQSLGETKRQRAQKIMRLAEPRLLFQNQNISSLRISPEGARAVFIHGTSYPESKVTVRDLASGIETEIPTRSIPQKAEFTRDGKGVVWRGEFARQWVSLSNLSGPGARYGDHELGESGGEAYSANGAKVFSWNSLSPHVSLGTGVSRGVPDEKTMEIGEGTAKSPSAVFLKSGQSALISTPACNSDEAWRELALVELDTMGNDYRIRRRYRIPGDETITIHWAERGYALITTYENYLLNLRTKQYHPLSALGLGPIDGFNAFSYPTKRNTLYALVGRRNLVREIDLATGAALRDLEITRSLAPNLSSFSGNGRYLLGYEKSTGKVYGWDLKYLMELGEEPHE